MSSSRRSRRSALNQSGVGFDSGDKPQRVTASNSKTSVNGGDNRSSGRSKLNQSGVGFEGGDSGWDSGSTSDTFASGGWDSTPSTSSTSGGKKDDDGWGSTSTSGGDSWGSTSSGGGDSWSSGSGGGGGGDGWDSGSSTSGGGGDSWGSTGDSWGSSGGGGDGWDSGAGSSGGWLEGGGGGTSTTPANWPTHTRQAYHRRLRHIFFNVGNPEDIQRLNRARPKGIEESLWTQAMKDNPDPGRLTPVQADGFKDLEARIRVQQDTTAQHAQTVRQIKQNILQIKKHHELTTLTTIERHKRHCLQQANRVLELLAKIELLKAKGTPIGSEEDNFRSKLDSIQRQLQEPNQFRSQLRELEAVVSLHESVNADAYQTLDESSLDSLTSHLAEQQAGISQLRDLLKDDMSDLIIIEKFLSELRASSKR